MSEAIQEFYKQATGDTIVQDFVTQFGFSLGLLLEPKEGVGIKDNHYVSKIVWSDERREIYVQVISSYGYLAAFEAQDLLGLFNVSNRFCSQDMLDGLLLIESQRSQIRPVMRSHMVFEFPPPHFPQKPDLED